MSENTIISKTSFLKYDQCSKAFFLYRKHPYLRDAVSKEKQFTFNRGHEVGELAQQLFPGGIDVSKRSKNSKEAYEVTKLVLDEGVTTIYEATFIFDHVLVMVDILHFDGVAWKAYEVKSSLKVSDTYVKDACIQYYVLKNILPAFDDLFLVTLNQNYLLEDKLDVRQLFKKRSIKKDGEKNLEFFHHQVEQMKLVLERNTIPDIPIGPHCFSPYACDFLGTCWKNTKDERSVFNIGKTGRDQLFEFYFSGADTVDKIDLTGDLRPHIKIQAESLVSGEPFLNRSAIKDLLEQIKGNVCFLDMEIWSPAIPKYQATSPFEQIPFLFSVCNRENDEIKFKNFLKPIETDSRELFLQELLSATKEFDSVLVYDKNLELQVLAKLSNLFKGYEKEADALRNKMIDLSEPVQNFSFYHPKFKGYFSLKAVSEIFDAPSGYEGLEIASGIVAMHKYQSLLHATDLLDADETKRQLIQYCNLDTLTCMRFFEYLNREIKG